MKRIMDRENYVTICKTCDTQFEFSPDEEKIIYLKDDDSYLSVECPVCRMPIYLHRLAEDWEVQ